MAAARSPALTGRRRRAHDWNTPRKPQPQPKRSPSSVAPSPDAEPTILPPGTDVEVRVDGKGLYGTWFAATVVDFAPVRGRGYPARYTVTYADDDGGVLAERFAPSHVRPQPPSPESPPRFLPHDAVEAFHNCGWWSGIVVSAAPASVTVAFPITREVIPFPPRLVRPRRDYVGGGEWVPSRAVIAVRPKGAVRVYDVGEKVEVGRDRELYGYSWFPATVAKVIDDLSYVVEYLDLEEEGGGSVDKVTEYLHWQFVRPVVERLPWESEFHLGPGAAVEAHCDGAWSAGVVRRVVGDGELEVSINGSKGRQLVTKAVEFLKPRYKWEDGKHWRSLNAKKQADFRRLSASGKCPRPNIEVTFSDDAEHSHDPEYSGSKKARKELQQKVAVLAEGSEHASVSMDTPLSVLENSPASIHPPNSCSPLYGHSTAPKIDTSDNVQNQLERKRKLLCKVYTSKKIASKKKKERMEEPHSLHSSLESPSTGQEIGVNEVAGPQRESSLILESKKSTQQLLDRTMEDTMNANEVTYQEPVAMVPLSFESSYNDIDIHGSKLDEGLTASSSGCQENRNADALRHNTGTQVPFVKRSHLWSIVEELDVFKEFPQQPHFLPLQDYLPGLREGTAFGLMMSFNHFVESMRKSSIADNERSFEEKKCILAELKTNGFDVQYFESLLDKVIKVKFEYTKHLEEKSAVEAQKLGAISSLSRNDSLLCEIDEAMAELEQKLEHLRQKGQLIEKEKEDDEEKLSRLNVVESSVKKALDADKRQFHSILAGMLQKQLT